MVVPREAHLASVAPHPNSMSSGCAPIANALVGVARSTEMPPRAGSSFTGTVRAEDRRPLNRPPGSPAKVCQVRRPVDVVGQGWYAEHSDGQPQPRGLGAVGT